MKSRKECLEDVLKIARQNIPPAPGLLQISLEKGAELAEFYQADKELVLIGICLMDIQLSAAINQGRQKEHVIMSSDFAKSFLSTYDLTESEYDQIINCVEAHHKDIPFSCIEAEICANADCYRFIHPRGVFIQDGVLSKRTDDFAERIDGLNRKLEEKHNILSLDKAKEELEDYYQMFRKLFDEII